MNAEPLFELSGTHDAGSVAATAKLLFQRFWRSMLVPVGIGLALAFVSAIWAWFYLKITTGLWILTGLVALEIAILIHMRWRIRRTLKARIGKSIEVRLTPENVSWTSGGEAHTFPWSRFKAVSTDRHNIYLFLAKTVVLTVPNQDDPQEAARFAASRLGGVQS